MIYSKRKKLHEEVNKLANQYGCKIIRCSLDSDVLDIQFKLPETIITPDNKKLTELDIKFERYGFRKISSFYSNSLFGKVIGNTKYLFEFTNKYKIDYKSTDVLYNHKNKLEEILNLEFFKIEKFEKFLKDREIIDKDFTVIKQKDFIFNPMEYGFITILAKASGLEYTRMVNGFHHIFYQKGDKWEYTRQDIRFNSLQLCITDIDFKSPDEVDAFLIKQRIYYRRVKSK